jgi:hypothetical protein
MDEENLMDEDHEDDVLSLENTQLVQDNVYFSKNHPIG